jgi:hypothetical protein
VALMLAPRLLLRRLGRPSPGVVAVTRILGARHVAEVVILAHRGYRSPPRWALIVDAVHAASMLALATRSRRLRREALTSATAAAVLAGLTEIERRQT